ncbi:esterase-like activity of phytase family protein [Aliiglaciecola sp. LCG003]|uniref:esterase-like activity of phytase family protein n=1 Tax=Aliiglaciecola sp. LCG003 TaxID=3053655 RepID=UPI0025746C52|nr:esterase-like activity of phytase family protein [Aliiglaciecola sp. LCG003]WJG10509.1 esterase-like activity of phytase family protein [Aliiglaciecola sp. LCG003]
MRIKKGLSLLSLAFAVPLGLSGCMDDGEDGAAGANGTQGTPGIVSLVRQTTLFSGDAQCFQGGTEIASGLDHDGDAVLADSEVTQSTVLCATTQLEQNKHFNRIAVFPVCQQIDATCDDNTETSAEIVAANADGTMLIYSDSPNQQIGFVNINDPANPIAMGTLALPGEPTSVSVKGDYALVGVNRSADFINVAGSLEVVEISTLTIVANIDLSGQPDSVAVSPDGLYAAVVIENERDEDLSDGSPPQLPAGNLQIVTLNGSPDSWATSTVALTGIADLYPDDPEPEFVDINSDNIAVITLQENNHIVLVDLTDGSIVNHFSAGTVNLNLVDNTEEGALISQTESVSEMLREPDGVTWLSTEYFATADEGDLNGGGRGFTVFNTHGQVIYAAGNFLEHQTARVGHYPDERSGNKGNEPENAEFGVFGDERYLFVNSERSSLVFVYDVADLTKPKFKQVLPAGAAPEGSLAIPSRNLLVVASEADDRGDKLRSVVNIYNYTQSRPQYPTLVSVDRTNGTPIPFSALSGLAADRQKADLVYSIEDSFYKSNRIFAIDVGQTPAVLTGEINIKDENDVFAGLTTVALADSTVADDHVSRIGVFDEADLAAMINPDKTVNIDPEGIAQASDGGFWIASEGAGTLGDDERPVNSLNLLFKTDASGVIQQAITLPEDINGKQIRFGFEGVADYDGKVYVAFQRVWSGDDSLRIGVYDQLAQSWSFLFYPLDMVESQNGGWVGLSDIASMGNGKFWVLERDNQGGPDAAIKRIYAIDINGAAEGDLLRKSLIRDLMTDLQAPNGLVYEKIEGLAVTINGEAIIVNDNDGVDDNSGEIQLINLGNIQ